MHIIYSISLTNARLTKLWYLYTTTLFRLSIAGLRDRLWVYHKTPDSIKFYLQLQAFTHICI